jgi:hypothetical protein
VDKSFGPRGDLFRRVAGEAKRDLVAVAAIDCTLTERDDTAALSMCARIWRDPDQARSTSQR